MITDIQKKALKLNLELYKDNMVSCEDMLIVIEALTENNHATKKFSEDYVKDLLYGTPSFTKTQETT